MDFRLVFKLFLVCLLGEVLMAEGLACNWGTRVTHPLPPDIAVKLMKDNGIDKVKLFEVVPDVMGALGNSGIQVMVGIPNDMLASLASSVRVAEDWVTQNVSRYVSRNGVDIRYVAIGNEPFLKTYKDMFTQTIYPALENIQAALIKAGLGRQVKVTIPINADVYQSDSGMPSGGNFRPDIHGLMISIVKFLSDNGGPLTINIYPFLSLYADPHFPVDFAFFDGAAAPVVDGGVTYGNVFEANYDTLVWSLEKNGFPNLPIIVGEVGWPTDGDVNANIENARRFNQGLLNRINQGKGTPKRASPPDIYLFALIDEDAKSTEPGNFERHWGIFYYDGSIKYPLNLANNKNLTAAKGVQYLSRQWCVMRPDADPSDPNLPQSINKACTYADCTSLGYGSSCGGLDVRNNASYAFNMYFQTMNQTKGSCDQFSNLSVITSIDPSTRIRGGACRFEIMIDIGKGGKTRKPTTSSAGRMYNSIFASSFLLGLLAFVS
ncbi:glucan endo-1,3-beta-glucosidase 5 [Coffea arabica]|uniref:glucan endo-1,3-beta-D-glucosidase n=1 Tax=Coffea arabica TaxID=13443 RepID=A0A6P6SW92_COFAR|nr:glucan endo-1,3-beta-glucosidase 5-like [Coffea arabica]